jgi:hypothetical protein
MQPGSEMIGGMDAASPVMYPGCRSGSFVEKDGVRATDFIEELVPHC